MGDQAGMQCSFMNDRRDIWNEAVEGSVGEIPQLVGSFPLRRVCLGTYLMEKVIEFCKEQGLPCLVVDIPFCQSAAIILFYKKGFVLTSRPLYVQASQNQNARHGQVPSAQKYQHSNLELSLKWPAKNVLIIYCILFTTYMSIHHLISTWQWHLTVYLNNNFY